MPGERIAPSQPTCLFDHKMVIHQENFVNLNYPDIHTQTVENLWMRAKRKNYVDNLVLPVIFKAQLK
jgi:hypothetical protein